MKYTPSYISVRNSYGKLHLRAFVRAINNDYAKYSERWNMIRIRMNRRVITAR